MILKASHDSLKKIIKHSAVYGFFNCIEKSDALSHYVFGPSGELLRETIRNEWIFSSVIDREHNIFMYNSNLEKPELIPEIKESFLWVKNFSNAELPFGLANIRHDQANKISGLEILKPQKSESLRYYAFLGPQEAEQFFYRYQQQRKRWWRKFSLEPGKFTFAEVEKNCESSDSVAKIIAKFPWGIHTLETIHYLGAKPFEALSPADSNLYTVKNLKKRCFPHVILCEVDLDYAVISYICDAFNTKKGKVILKFHRKLAPFKFSFAASPESEEDNKSLFEVAELICLQLRKAGLSCLFPVKGEFAKKKLEMQLLKSDSFGVPYTAILTKDTLSTGLFGLHSRDTTLQEDVHISKMPEYGALLMKNY